MSSPLLTPSSAGCEDLNEHCKFFANDGECTNVRVRPWMSQNCKKSCPNYCNGGAVGGGSGVSGM